MPDGVECYEKFKAEWNAEGRKISSLHEEGLGEKIRHK